MTTAALLTALPAIAGSTCYAPEQVRAEHLLRLHSELMVITVMCRQGSNGEDLSPAYVAFTKNNIGVLHNAEQTMIAYYREKGAKNSLDKLDQLRTRLGNEFGQKAARLSAPAFCASYRDKVVQFEAAAPADLETEVHHMETTLRPSVKPCAAGKTVTTIKGR